MNTCVSFCNVRTYWTIIPYDRDVSMAAISQTFPLSLAILAEANMGSFIPILIANNDQITYYIANYLQQYIIDHSKLSVCLSVYPSILQYQFTWQIYRVIYLFQSFLSPCHVGAVGQWCPHVHQVCNHLPQNRVKNCLESGFPGGKSQSRMLLFAQHGVT